MRRSISVLSVLLCVGCGGPAAPPSDGGRDDDVSNPAFVVETLVLAILRRDEDLYESQLTEDFDVVNEAGVCLDWLQPGYWSESEPGPCGGALVGFDLAITSQRLVADDETELMVVADFAREETQGTGFISSARMVLVTVPSTRGFLIRELRVVPLLRDGT
jgi:hypothetical protein